MSGRERGGSSRAVDVLRVAVGIGHAVRVVRGSAHPVLDSVLAVRQVGQAALVGRADLVGRGGSADAHTLSAVVDVVHGATMVPLALFDPRRRAFALGQVLIAVALAGAEVAAVGSGRRRG